MKIFALLAAAYTVTAAAQSAEAQSPAVEKVAATPAPYSLPWGLRGATPATVVRADSSIAFYHDSAGRSGSTGVSLLYASVKVHPVVAGWVRGAVVGNSAPGAASAVASVVNPAIGVTVGPPVNGPLRGSGMLGVALPVGMGGGNSPNAATLAAVKSGIWARSAMDNAMFAVNDLVVFPGVDAAFVSSGFTLQVEATMLFLMRVRGEQAQPDAFKLNFTTGVHVGYFVLPWLSLGAEFRYQRWLVAPKAATGELISQATFAVGPRFHFKVAGVWVRPGLSYSRGFDAPMSANGYNVLQLDVPVFF